MALTTTSVGEAAPLEAQIARVWPRLAADAADVALVGLLGLVIGFLVGDLVAPAGTPARLVGLLIAVPYFGLAGSRLTGGQTFGKTLLKLRVVDSSGHPLSLKRSTARSILVTAPWIFNGLQFSSPSIVARLALWTSSVLVFGLAVASIGTFLFTPATRQTVHDLVVGSYVVEESDWGRSVIASTPRAVAIVAGVWIAIVGVASSGIWTRPVESLAPEPLSAQLASIPNVSHVQFGGLVVTKILGSGSGDSQRMLNVVFWYHGPEDGLERAKRAVASAMLWHHPGLGSVPQMRLTVVRGWDLGVARWTTSETDTLTLDAWRSNE